MEGGNGGLGIVRFSESYMAKEIPDTSLAGLASGIPFVMVVGRGYSSGCSSSFLSRGCSSSFVAIL